jgi:hypothetical protein
VKRQTRTRPISARSSLFRTGSGPVRPLAREIMGGSRDRSAPRENWERVRSARVGSATPSQLDPDAANERLFERIVFTRSDQGDGSGAAGSRGHIAAPSELHARANHRRKHSSKCEAGRKRSEDAADHGFGRNAASIGRKLMQAFRSKSAKLRSRSKFAPGLQILAGITR